MLASADAGGAVRRQRCESMARPAAAALGWLGQDGVLASSERPAISVRCGERRGSLGGTTGSSWRCGSDHCKPVPWSGRRLLRVVLDLVDGAGWLWFLSRLGVGGATIVLLAVRPVVDPRLAVALAKCCGGGSVNLLGRCCPIPGGVVRCDARMKILLGFHRASSDGTRGCHPPHWRRRRGVFVTSLAHSELWLSPDDSLDLVLDRHNGGVIDIVPLLGALGVETWLVP